MIITRPRGTNDILPGEVETWHHLEYLMQNICREFGYQEIRTPIFEHTELFLRGVGDTTDIVAKEMYTFSDRSNRSISLRPENTASVARAFLENKLYAGLQPVKLYYNGPMFRYDRPQAGRYRQFHQFGVEVFGTKDPAADAEVITLAMDYFCRLGLGGLMLHINSVGCPECRPVLREALERYFRPILTGMCPDCRKRFVKNPLRLLDCKEKSCREAFADTPSSLDCICESCLGHFSQVREILDVLGIDYYVDRFLVRGLDYYTNTAFEITAPHIGSQSSIGGGGRYNGLVENYGGPPSPGVGFAIGLERTILALEKQGIRLGEKRGPDVFVLTAGQGTAAFACKLLHSLRSSGISSDKDYFGRGLKAQMKYASKVLAKYVLLIGEDELKKNAVVVRDMTTGIQENVPAGEVVEYIKNVLVKTEYDRVN